MQQKGKKPWHIAALIAVVLGGAVAAPQLVPAALTALLAAVGV